MKGDKLILVAAILIISIFLVSCKPSNILPNNAPVVIPPVNNPTDSQAVVNNTVTQTTSPSVVSSGFDTSRGFTDKDGCYDSEGGKFYEKRGYIIDAGKNRFEDICISSNSLREYYCGIVGYKEEESYSCPNGCKDGACIKDAVDSPNKCVDSDFKDYYKKGQVTYQGKTTEDVCKDANILIEQICSIAGVAVGDEKFCRTGCVNGACNPEDTSSNNNCSDPDFGQGQEFTRTNVTDPRGTVEDSCLNSRTVKEWKCSDIGYRIYTNIECTNGCVDGVCVK